MVAELRILLEPANPDNARFGIRNTVQIRIEDIAYFLGLCQKSLALSVLLIKAIGFVE